MDVTDFCQTYPRLYHMAHAEAWESIRRHGLLSTSALLDLFEVEGDERTALESRHRPQSVPVVHEEHGRAVIRDQKPMNDNSLMKCLDGATPQEWYELLNTKVFFWVNKDRLERLLRARAYCRQPQLVITLDTAKVVEVYRDQITLCPINSGACLYIPQPRSRTSFQSIEAFDFLHWRRKGRRPENVVVECAVTHSVTDIERFLIEVEVRPPSKPK